MKKFAVAVLAALLTVSCIAAVPAAAADGGTYTLRDEFGAAPLARTLSENMERTELNNELSGYSRYGFAARLKAAGEDGADENRGYITYDVDGVTEAEVSALVAESNFGAYHGWGVSLGVTDDAAGVPLNNINNINLDLIYPMYLSEEGRPFIHYNDGKWYGYIADPKYSFITQDAVSDAGTNQRAFTVPDAVQGVFDEDGMTLLQNGYLYPMINLEYATAEAPDTWIPMSLDTESGNYDITSAEYVGADKMYDVTVKISNIPAEAAKIRIGANYIRETIKPSATGDLEADVYQDFPRAASDSLFVTGVHLTLDTEYTGGFEELQQTGIDADPANMKRYYAYGEAFSAEGLVLYDVYNGGIREENADTSSFTVDSSAFNPYDPGIYAINVTKGDYSDSFNVQVSEPDALSLDTSALDLEIAAGETFSAEGLEVSIVSSVSGRGEVAVPLTAEQYTVDASAVNVKKDGTYTVSVTFNEGEVSLSASFDVTVSGNGAGSAAGGGDNTVYIVCGVVGGVIVIGAAAAVIIILRRKHS